MSTIKGALALDFGKDVVLGKKFERLKSRLQGYQRMVLAFSGGADSAFVLAAAKAAGTEVLAITLVSSFFTQKEKQGAKDLAQDMGADHLCLDTDILENEDVQKNTGQRCYFCKRHGFSMIEKIAGKKGIHHLVHGINTDDLGEDRPGIRAARELGFKAPLVEESFSKQEIRACSKVLGLVTWDLPSQSCLATRIPTGEPIVPATLKMVEAAESLLEELGFKQFRVRCHHNCLARIQADPKDFSRLVSPHIREQVVKGLTRLGFCFVSLDLGGISQRR
ncbi:MAG: ATP-dependent sacrificial sulfur transferase LarE [Desulfobacter sp.]|nr:MAG: ATP-dependent sacrificial sulfur transferase LarE [Desulfobacter sp.]